MLEMLDIRHSIERHLNSIDCNCGAGGTDLETGEMDIAFDYDGRAYKITLQDRGASE